MSHKKPHPIINKLKHAIRHDRLWHVKKFLDKKRELKKRGVTNGGQQMNNQFGGRFKYWKEGVKGFCIGFFGLFAITALAGSGGAIVTDHYHNVEYSEPYSVKVCRNEAVASGNAVNDAIWGGIFGAVIGDAIDDEDGKVPGAIIGALIGANNGNNATMTPAAVCRTETRYHTIQRGEYSHSTIEFDYEGARYRLNFTKR